MSSRWASQNAGVIGEPLTRTRLPEATKANDHGDRQHARRAGDPVQTQMSCRQRNRADQRHNGEHDGERFTHPDGAEQVRLDQQGNSQCGLGTDVGGDPQPPRDDHHPARLRAAAAARRRPGRAATPTAPTSSSPHSGHTAHLASSARARAAGLTLRTRRRRSPRVQPCRRPRPGTTGRMKRRRTRWRRSPRSRTEESPNQPVRRPGHGRPPS